MQPESCKNLFGEGSRCQKRISGVHAGEGGGYAAEKREHPWSRQKIIIIIIVIIIITIIIICILKRHIGSGSAAWSRTKKGAATLMGAHGTRSHPCACLLA